MRSISITLIAAVGATVACTHSRQLDLVPAPSAVIVPGPGDGATATVAGVRVEARVNAWKWGPATLEQSVTPVLVQIDNNSTRPLLIRYTSLQLIGNAQRRLSAMPPYDINGTLQQSYTVRNPFYGIAGFDVAPYLWRYYPFLTRFDGAFPYDSYYYDPYITRFRQVQLPTPEMIQRALPEGVLRPGGRLTGFVYFEPVSNDAERVRFKETFLDSRTHTAFGSVAIPFVNNG